MRTLYEFDATSRTPRKTPRRSPPRRISPLLDSVNRSRSFSSACRRNASSSDPPRARGGAEAGSRGPLHQSCVYRRAVTAAEGCGFPLIVVLCFQPLAYSFAVFHQSGRTPLLPLYALFQFIAPEELTLRTLYEFDATSRTQEKTPGDHCRGAFPRCLDSVNRSRSFFPTGRHPFYFHGVLCPRRALRR